MRPRHVPTSPLGRARRRVLALAVLAVVAISALPALAASDDATGCPDPLARFTPDGVDGDVTAVAITSQVLEAGRDGWASVGWETFGETVLDSVTIVHSDGEVVRTDDLAAGTASDVQELVFCGSPGGHR
jgi:hypothetical protein